MARGRTWLVVMLVVAGAVALSASSASASGVVCPGCTGIYTGSWTAHTQYTDPDGDTATQDLSLNWTETLQTAPGAGEPVWSLASAQGTISYNLTGDAPEQCTASLTPNPALAADITEFAPQVVVGASGIAVSAYPPTWWSGDPASAPQVLVSSDNTNDNCSYTPNDTQYNSGFWTTFTGSSCHYAGTGAEAMSFPLSTSTTIGDSCAVQGSDGTLNGKKGTATLSSQLTLTPPGPSSCAVPATVQRAHRAVLASARVASGGSLSATVTRLPRGFAGQVTVLAISADDGRIVAARTLASGATRTTLSLPSDRYAILAEAAFPAGRPRNHDGIGALVTVHAGRRATVRVALGRPPADADVHRTRAAPGYHRSDDRGTGQPLALTATASGAVVTVNGINLTFPDGSQVSLDDPAVTDLFPTWHDQDGITFVETGKQFTDFAQREQDLSDSGRLDPPYHFEPITPDFTISGDARIDRKGRMSITIEIRDRCTGQVIARITITRRLRGGPGSIRYDAGIASALRDALSQLQPPSTISGCGCA